MVKKSPRNRNLSDSIKLCIRKATLADIPGIKASGLDVCFPEVDPITYISFFNESIPSPLRVVYVAEYGGHIVGHVIAEMLKEEPEEASYMSSLGVRPSHRKLGIGAKLMIAAENAMVEEYGCECAYLHVLVSNLAAINLYSKILGYGYHDTAAKFRGGEEDAYVMRKQLQGKQLDSLVLGFNHGGGCLWSEDDAELLGLLDRMEIC